MDEILNNSYFKNIQKQKYSFPKSSRFPDLKAKYTIDYYDQNSSMHKQRSTSFGYGTKYDIFKETTRRKGPSPSQYSIDPGHITRGMSFGLGRDEIKSNSYIDRQKFKGPRVGQVILKQIQYQSDIAIRLKNKAPSCVLVSRHPQDSFIIGNTNPDPTKYTPIENIQSRRKRSAQFGFGSSKRFQYDTNVISRVLGPGTYTIQQKSSPKGGIGRAIRKTYAVQAIDNSISPGPKYFIK